VRRLQVLALITVLAGVGCGGGSSHSNGGFGGGGGGGTSGNNVQPILVDGGPPSLLKQGVVYVNGVFTTVTVCAPGTSSCQTIDHVLVDTGSFGLRLLATANDPTGLSLQLPPENDASGHPLGECVQFADKSYLWGPVRLADVKIGGTNNTGEVASNIPIHVAGDSTFPSAPGACSTNGSGSDANSLNGLGANGILGVGVFPQDCGGFCTPQGSPNAPPTPFYYACPASGCTPSYAAVSQQVVNPIVAFAVDSNGVILQLPAIASTTGTPSVTGSMVFGIGTQSNNALPSGANIFGLNGFGSFRTTYKGVNYGPYNPPGTTTDSYIDSGSNGLFFPDTSIPNCPDPNPGSGFFCPGSPLTTLTARQVSADGTTSNAVGFSIVSAQTLFAANNGTNTAFNNLGGKNSGVFDWGLPFFFGRTVYTAIDGQATPAPIAAPYWAY
jgi:hypothetical protein